MQTKATVHVHTLFNERAAKPHQAAQSNRLHNTESLLSHFFEFLNIIAAFVLRVGLGTRYGLDSPGIESRWG
jgi:hypothetical protein